MVGSQAFALLVDELKKSGFIKSQRELAERLGVHEQVLTDAKTKENKDRTKLLISIQETFPGFDLSGFIGGESSKKLEVLQGFNKKPEAAEKTISFFDMDVSAGPVEMFSDMPEIVTKRFVIPGFEDCHLAINIWGDSMYPEYKAGDMVLCKEVSDKRVINYGEAYLVVTNELRAVKYVQKGSAPDTLTLRSENEKFEPFEVPRDSILKMFLVKGKVRRNTI